MANLVKTKASITGLSFLILALIPLLETNFLSPVVLKRWTQITWQDFEGIPRPFSKYDAVISSGIHLEYDSALKRYRAYAAQNNVESWVKDIGEGDLSDHLLRHEQYHFNITEMVARITDYKIANNPDQEQAAYVDQIKDAEDVVDKLQKQFDLETYHGAYRHWQKKWEFTIDSLMQGDNGWLTDPVSGASIFLPTTDTPRVSETVVMNTMKRRQYDIKSYDVSFTMRSMQFQDLDDSQVANVKSSLQKNDGGTLLRRRGKDLYKEYFRSIDSTGLITYSVWIQRKNALHTVSASFREFMRDTLGYYQVANSVIRSLKVKDAENTKDVN